MPPEPTADGPFDLQKVQRLRKVAITIIGLVIVVGLLSVGSTWPQGTETHELIERCGLLLIAAGIIGRAWCSLYIGGRKRAEIVDTGPYSVSRNPLYMFSFVAAGGMGAQTGSMTVAVALTLIAVLVFAATVRREEAWLSAAFGQGYSDYCSRVPRFIPDFRLWRSEDTLEVRPVFFVRTLGDGLFFLLAIPLFEGIDWAHISGWLPVVLRLP